MGSGQELSNQAAAPVLVPRSQVFGAPAPMGFFTQVPADITLVRHGNGARNGQLWIRTSVEGLFVAGTVDGDLPDFPHTKEQILSKDHVELWLSGSPDIDLPPIGWGDQFGDTVLPKGPDSCADWAKPFARPGAPDLEKMCKDWAALQVRYRAYLKKLFVREWVVSPDYAVESFATPAYDEIQKDFSKLGDDFPEIMKPKGSVKMFLFPEQSGYSFQISIPFEALPPLPSLSQGELYFSLDVFNAMPAGKNTAAYSTSSPARVNGKADTFNLLRLEVPFRFSLTPCQMPLAGIDKRGAYHPAWFIPERGPGNEYESEAFILVNDPAGYRYDPAGLSPGVRTTDYFWKDAGPGEWICGPHLTYRKGGQSQSFPYTISEDGFDTRRLPDGDLLIKTGPRVWYSEFGSGQCGACPRTDLRIFDLTKSMKLFGALGLGDVMNSPRLFSQDFTVSPDWSEITEYDLKGDEESQPGSWSSTTWCLKPESEKEQAEGHTYEKCGEKEGVQPPNPPVLKELRNWEN
jgi:hypothetical protein